MLLALRSHSIFLLFHFWASKGSISTVRGYNVDCVQFRQMLSFTIYNPALSHSLS